MEMAEKELKDLDALLDQGSVDDANVATKLSQLRVTARVPQNAPFVYTRAGIAILGKAAFDETAQKWPKSSLEAARILANALLLQPETQQMLTDLKYSGAIAKFYGDSDVDHEFVGARILFLLTYKSKTDFVSLIENHGLLEFIDSHLKAHIPRVRAKTTASGSMECMAMIETLKLLYNLASKFPGQMHFMSKTTKQIIQILCDWPLGKDPLEPPVAQLLNSLAILDWSQTLDGDEDDLFLSFTEKLIQILERCISALKPSQLETVLIPLITVLRKVNEMPHDKAKLLLRLSLLPQDEERVKPLGQSQTLASQLLRLQTSAGLTILPDAISALLFDLSERDATKFVHNIGYGHAAGYLMTHKIAIPESLKTQDQANVKPGTEINPITGQRLDAEVPVTMPEMSEAEKEREAERLFVLFERLKATGVVDVENPLRAAQHSGRFEELSDSEND